MLNELSPMLLTGLVSCYRLKEIRLRGDTDIKMASTVFQFKITLMDIEPPIWRRIHVPENYNFWDLHVAIQDSMGWLDSHLHVFRIKKKHSQSVTQIGIPTHGDMFGDEQEIIPGWDISVSRYFEDIGKTCKYEYDFGDCWQHEIQLEGKLLREKDQKYPKCIDGERACPPEDVGGVGGYYHLLEVLSDPKESEYAEMIEWLGVKYEPGKFDPAEVKFDNPKKRWENAFTEGA